MCRGGFEEELLDAMAAGGDPRLIGNWLSGEVVAWTRAAEIAVADSPLTAAHLVELAELVADSTLSASAAKQVLTGVLGGEGATEEESFSEGLLEYPQYTRPAEFRGRKVPEVLLSGNHGEIAAWRKEQAIRRTRRNRPDLLDPSPDEGI